MMHKKTLACALVGTVLMSACAQMSETQKGSAIGAGIGAVTGAVIGRATAGGNKGRSTSTGAAVGAAAGAGIGYLWSRKMEEQKQAMEQAAQGTGVEVSQTSDNRLKLDIPSDISFDVNRSNIKSNFAPLLDKFANSLRQHTSTTVTIVGHTDSSGSDAVNDPLSLQRADSTRDYLVSRGVSANRFMIDGKGSHSPIADNNSAAGRAQNRRVEIFVAEPPQS